MKEDGKQDRRVEKTRKLISDALVSLIIEQGYETITVQNIIDRANVGRSTFYAHYQGKGDLLRKSMVGIVHSLIGEVENALADPAESEKRRRIISALPLFRHPHEQYQLYEAMVGGRGIDVVIKATREHLSGHIQERIEQMLPAGVEPSVPPTVMASYLAGSLMALLTWWLENRMPFPPEEMDEMFQQLVMPGVWAGMEA